MQSDYKELLQKFSCNPITSRAPKRNVFQFNYKEPLQEMSSTVFTVSIHRTCLATSNYRELGTLNVT